MMSAGGLDRGNYQPITAQNFSISNIDQSQLSIVAGEGGGGWHGSKGGDIRIDKPSQHVLERSSVVVTRDFTELRLQVTNHSSPCL